MSEGVAACGCTGQVTFQGLSRDYKARLWAVIALNASMFAVEMVGGAMAGSQALQADALDFLGDTLTYGMSLCDARADGPLGAGRDGVARFCTRHSTCGSDGSDRLPFFGGQRRERVDPDQIQRRRRQCTLRLALLSQ